MSRKIKTFDQLTQDHETLIGNGEDDVFGKEGLTATIPQNFSHGLHSAHNTEAVTKEWGIKINCPCHCPCKYIEDLDLGDITYTYDYFLEGGFEVPDISWNISEEYNRVSLFDFFDGIETFGGVNNKYCAWRLHSEEQYIGREEQCESQIYILFSGVTNSGDDISNTGAGYAVWNVEGNFVGSTPMVRYDGGNGGNMASAQKRTLLTAAWTLEGWPVYVNGGGSREDFPDEGYPRFAIALGSWFVGPPPFIGENDTDEIDLAIPSQVTTGVRAYVGNETFPTWPNFVI